MKLVCTAKYQIFLFKIEILSPKLPLFGLKKQKIISWKNFLQEIFSTDRLFCVNRQFALIIKNGSLLLKNQRPGVGLWWSEKKRKKNHLASHLFIGSFRLLKESLLPNNFTMMLSFLKPSICCFVDPLIVIQIIPIYLKLENEFVSDVDVSNVCPRSGSLPLGDVLDQHEICYCR